VDTLIFVSSDGKGTRVLTHHLNVVAGARDLAGRVPIGRQTVADQTCAPGFRNPTTMF